MSIMDIIRREKEKFRMRQALKSDIKKKISEEKIKSVKDVRKSFERGSIGYKAAMNELAKEKREQYKEEKAFKEAVKKPGLLDKLKSNKAKLDKLSGITKQKSIFDMSNQGESGNSPFNFGNNQSVFSEQSKLGSPAGSIFSKKRYR